jgi:hypothetical protein
VVEAMHRRQHPAGDANKRACHRWRMLYRRHRLLVNAFLLSEGGNQDEGTTVEDILQYWKDWVRIIQGTFSEHSVNIEGTFSEHSINI